MKKARKVLALLLACLLIVLAFAGCGKKDGGTVKPVDSHGKRPKYVFLFIGDGMSYPQIQLTNYYRSINNQKGGEVLQLGRPEPESAEERQQPEHDAVPDGRIDADVRSDLICTGLRFYRDLHCDGPQDLERQHQCQ